MKAARYRRKPQVVEAIRYTADTAREIFVDWIGWPMPGARDFRPGMDEIRLPAGASLWPGQWLLRAGGGLRVRTDDEFRAEYEPDSEAQHG